MCIKVQKLQAFLNKNLIFSDFTSFFQPEVSRLDSSKSNNFLDLEISDVLYQKLQHENTQNYLFIENDY